MKAKSHAVVVLVADERDGAELGAVDVADALADRRDAVGGGAEVGLAAAAVGEVERARAGVGLVVGAGLERDGGAGGRGQRGGDADGRRGGEQCLAEVHASLQRSRAAKLANVNPGWVGRRGFRAVSRKRPVLVVLYTTRAGFFEGNRLRRPRSTQPKFVPQRETWIPSARGAAHTARVNTSGRRPSPCSRSARRNAPRTTIPPSHASGSPGTGGARLVERQRAVAVAGGQPGQHAAGQVRRADAVAGEAERVVDGAVVERADLRQVARRDVDRAAPGVRDRAPLAKPGSSRRGGAGSPRSPRRRPRCGR